MGQSTKYKENGFCITFWVIAEVVVVFGSAKFNENLRFGGQAVGHEPGHVNDSRTFELFAVALEITNHD